MDNEQELRRKARAFDLMVKHEITVIRMRDGTFVAEDCDFLEAQHKSALEAVELLVDQIEDLEDELDEEDDDDFEGDEDAVDDAIVDEIRNYDPKDDPPIKLTLPSYDFED